MMSKHLEQYQNNAVITASGPQLTLMLYNGCIKFINQGIKELEEKNYEQKNYNIQRAQDIIRELMITLDTKYEISKNMMTLYDYIYFRLQEGNIKNDVASLKEGLELVTEFRDTWKEAMKLDAKKYVQGAQV